MFHLSDSNNQDLLISLFAIRSQLAVGTDWAEDALTVKQTELRYSYRFICNESYYGESCSKKCTPRDDRFGHYTCNWDGQLSCLPGWKGKYCEERKNTLKFIAPAHLHSNRVIQRLSQMFVWGRLSRLNLV